MSSVDATKQIHKDVHQLVKDLSIGDQQVVFQETHNKVESLKRIQRITGKAKIQA
ncbi:MAG: hypothetical protein ACOC6H_04560 [Thermoproteota archaeon]